MASAPMARAPTASAPSAAIRAQVPDRALESSAVPPGLFAFPLPPRPAGICRPSLRLCPCGAPETGEPSALRSRRDRARSSIGGASPMRSRPSQGQGPQRFAAKILRGALEQGRAEVARRLSLDPDRGRAAARATAYLHDQLVRLAYDFVVDAADIVEPMAIVGLGGTGRGEMAPFSDLDLMFLTAGKPSPAQEASSRASDAPSAVGLEAQGRPFGPLDRRARCRWRSRT